jgi:hypothetical protein
VRFGGTTSREGDLPYSEVAMTVRRCRSSQLFQTSAVALVLRFLSFQHHWSPSLQNPLEDSNPRAQNSRRCMEITATSHTRTQLRKVEKWARTIYISRTIWRGARRIVLIMIVQSRPLPFASIQCLAMIVALLTHAN